jgi:hypothetical protein
MSEKINDHLVAKDIGHLNDLEFWFNWNKRREAKTIHIKMGDNEGEFDKDELWQLMFITAEEDWMDKMIPSKVEQATRFWKTVEVKATEDIKRGNSIKVRIPFNITNEVLEELAKQRGIKMPPLKGTQEGNV